VRKKEKQLNARVDDIKRLKKDVFLLSFVSDYLAKQSSPGNFIHLKIDPTILRRPFSIHKIKKNKVYILFRVRGRGTKMLSTLKKGCCLDIIGPLGKGFVIPESVNSRNRAINILIGGGLGVAPLVFLAEKLKKEKRKTDKNQDIILLGAKDEDDILCEEEFKRLKCKIFLSTDNGSKGIRGNVINLLNDKLKSISYQQPVNIYTCGPKQMLREMFLIIKKYSQVHCQASFEQYMGCGLGFCCGCAIETKQGYKKVCEDGPVFNLNTIWE